MLFRSNDTATTEIYTLSYTLSLHDALPISLVPAAARMVLPKEGQPRRFFVTHAWSMAGEVTPRIFSAL